jgi:hypothetical protein
VTTRGLHGNLSPQHLGLSGDRRRRQVYPALHPKSAANGCDIVPILVQNTRIRYGRPDREFRAVDLCHDTLPHADLLLCRDCLMHLSEEMIFRALANIVRSDVKYLLTTTYPDGRNRSIRNGDWFTVNLCAPPYSLPAPLRVIDDWVPPFDRRQLALWEIESLRPAVVAASEKLAQPEAQLSS